ncbi:MAG TPA: hypothetical protein VMC07_00410 [Candidatus Omnitrophota bacterium]|nr:hypothetical protein [Candidatus Omnitrophota bacterium]
MPKKRGRKASHRKVRRARQSVSPSRSVSKNVKIVFTNLLIFFALFLVSLALSIWVFPAGVFNSLFFIFMLGFGFISIAFLITLVIFLFLKLFQRRR